jgi:hypothetical protein
VAPLSAEDMETAPSVTSGSPVSDDFSDLLDAPAVSDERPYFDNFEDLLPEDSAK